MKRQGIVLAIMVVLISIVIYQNVSIKSEAQQGKVEELPKVGFKAPTFTLASLDGKTYSIPAEEKIPIVINFWASWCGPCRLEAPELVKLYNKYQGRLEIYAINLTTQDSVEDAKAFADHYDFTFPVLLDNDANKPVAKLYKNQAIPTTYFINKNGVIVDKIMGLTDLKVLESKFLSLATAD